jgi:hypothetical protein
MQLDTGLYRPVLQRLADGSWRVVDRTLDASTGAPSPGDAGARPGVGASSAARERSSS